MLTYIYRTLMLLIFVLSALSIFAFSLAYLFPGSALQNFSGLLNITAEQQQILTQQYRLDSNYIVQYLAYMERIFSGDWGLSFATQKPLLHEIALLLPATIELTTYALIISSLLGIPAGLLAAIKADSFTGRVISNITVAGYSLPIFWWALVLIMFFSVTLGWLPSADRIAVLYEIPHITGFMLPDILLSDLNNKQQAISSALQHLILPTLVLATFPTTVMIRFTRDAMLQVWEQNYIKTARAKGLSRSQVLYRHGLRNALLPVIRQVGLQFSTLITLAMITEVIFSWPGIGRWLIDSIYQHDYPAIQAGLLIISVLVIAVNILMEILHTVFNPLARKN